MFKRLPGIGILKMSPRFVLGRENVPCVAEVVNRSLKADCTDFKMIGIIFLILCIATLNGYLKQFQNNVIISNSQQEIELSVLFEPLKSCTSWNSTVCSQSP